MLLKDKFKKEIIGKLKTQLGKKNIYQVPRLEKIVINVGAGTYLTKTGRTIDEIIENLSKITGRKPVVVNTKLSVSNFKLRKGMANGVKVTLRGDAMYNFLEKLITIVLPRIRDFRGIPKKTFDKVGNYSLGVKDITVFPEINLEDISKSHGLQINFSIKSQEKSESFELLKILGLPFEK